MTASLKLPWQPLDPDGDGILARVVHDAGTEHVALFDTAEQARAVCDTMNRAAGVEAERSELAGELQAEHALVLECVHLLECWRDYQASRGVECGSPSAETDAFLRKWHCEPCPPLRTRAKVDAEIAEMVRDYVRDVGARDAFGSMERDRQKLLALVAEPTAPEIDPLHPTGRCTCSGEGRCDWCILACPGCSFRRCDCQCDPEVCSCEESERLKARVRELEGELAIELGISMGHQNQLTEVRKLLRALEHRLARIGEWADEYGSALVPRGADTYGEGIRACKAQVKALVSK